jgi:hypothetical protein
METKIPKKRGPAPTGKTPPRSIRVKPEVWQRWKDAAKKRGLDVSELIHKRMERV